jgi:hypothetical protein
MAKPFKRKCDKGRKGAPRYFKFKDANGVWQTQRGCSSYEETKRLQNKSADDARLRRAGLVNPKDDQYQKHEDRPLSEHLEDFRKMLVNKGGTARHAAVTKYRASRVLEMAGAVRISDIVLSKVQAAVANLNAQGLGLETCNHHVRAVKGFARWLYRDGRAREHVLMNLSTFNSATDKRRERRALTPEEATRVIAAAAAGPAVQGMSGPDRAMLYRLTMGTGLRARELGSLTPESFNLDGDPPRSASRRATPSIAAWTPSPSRVNSPSCSARGWPRSLPGHPSSTCRPGLPRCSVRTSRPLASRTGTRKAVTPTSTPPGGTPSSRTSSRAARRSRWPRPSPGTRPRSSRSAGTPTRIAATLRRLWRGYRTSRSRSPRPPPRTAWRPAE